MGKKAIGAQRFFVGMKGTKKDRENRIGVLPSNGRRCVRRWPLVVNAHVHPSHGHGYGRSPVCERRCTPRFELLLKALSQPGLRKCGEIPGYSTASVSASSVMRFALATH